MAMPAAALLASKPTETSPISTIDQPPPAKHPLRFTRHAAGTRPEYLPGREMFRDYLEAQYVRDPSVLERIAEVGAQTMSFLVERFVLENKFTLFDVIRLFSIMRVDPRPCLPANPSDADGAYVIDLYALPVDYLKHTYRRLSDAHDRCRAIDANPTLFKDADALLMPPIVISPPPTPPPSSDGEEECEEYEECEERGRRRRAASSDQRHSKRATFPSSRQNRYVSDDDDVRRYRTESEVVDRRHAAGLPSGWVREDRISPAGKEHFVILSPGGAIYSSFVKARAAVARA